MPSNSYAGPSRDGPPQQRLSLLHVSDLTSAVIAWLQRPEACEHAVYALDDGRADGYGWPDITAAARSGWSLQLHVPRGVLDAVANCNLWLARRFGYAPMLTPGKVRELCHEQWLATDNAAFGEATGWTPATPLSAGMEELFG